MSTDQKPCGNAGCFCHLLAAAPQPAAQPEPSCGWAGCPHGAECVHAKQPEPGGLTDWPKPALLVDCAQGFVEGWTRSQVELILSTTRKLSELDALRADAGDGPYYKQLYEEAEAENAALRARCEAADALLRDLSALVWGECPSLFDEDSGGDSRLAIAIDAHLKGAGRE